MENEKVTTTELTDAQRNAMLDQMRAEMEQDKAAIQKELASAAPESVPDTQEVPLQVAETHFSDNPPKKEKTEDLGRFKDKEGIVRDEKIVQSNENLAKEAAKAEAEAALLKSMSPEQKREYLLTKNKELHAKFTRSRQELAKEVRSVEPSEPTAQPRSREELKKMFLEHVEKDPFEAIDQYIDFRLKSDPLRSEFLSQKERLQERDNLSTLERIVDSGNEWILNDAAQVERAKARAEEDGIDLSKVRNPYSVLARYSDSPQGIANGKAQPGPKTPILSATGAVPPPASDATASLETKANYLSAQMESAIRKGDFRKAKEYETKIGELLGR